MEVSRVRVVIVNKDGHFLLSGHNEGAVSPLQRAPASHSQKRGPGSSQAVLEAGGRDRAAVVCWLGSASSKYHLGLQAFWCGGSILLPKLTSLVTDTASLPQMCNLKDGMQVSYGDITSLSTPGYERVISLPASGHDHA